MRLIVGLGNPGKRYQHTRHNVGYMTLDGLAERLKVTVWREQYDGEVAESTYGGERLLLLKPTTYMNLSGRSVGAAAQYLDGDLGRLLVVSDDADLPLGQLRLRRQGSAGGHKGLISIIEHLGTQEFPRLRIGVGRSEAEGDLAAHVLGRFTTEEQAAVERMIARAVDAVVCVLSSGLERAMSEYNAA